MVTVWRRVGKQLGHHAQELTIAVVFAVVAAIGYEWWHERGRAEAIERAREAVVTVIAYDGDHKAIAQGSGVFVNASGLLATNYHVIRNAAEVEAHVPGGAFYRMEDEGIRFSDEARDIALIKFDAAKTPSVRFGDPARLSAGDPAFVIGTPDGQESTVALGNISHPDRVVSGQHLIQFTAAISPGSSGGGLFVQDGRVVGITAYSRRNPEDQNLNFAVPIDVVRAAIDKEATIAKGSPSYYYVQGNLAGDRRAWDTAVRHYSRAIALNPRYAEAYAGRANAHFELRQYARELDDYAKARALAPTDPVIALYLGNAYDDVGRYRDAIAAYKRTLELKPDYPFALQALLLDYLAVGDHAAAGALLPKLSAVDPGLGQQMALIVGRVK